MQASGTLQSLATGVRLAFETDALGIHDFDTVAFGRYRLHVAKPGFADQSVLVDVASTELITRTVKLSLGMQTFAADVVATAPLAGVDRSLHEVAAPIQSASKADIANSNALDLSDFLNRRLNGVYLNEIQGSPVQPDVSYRGYTASPLLGTPQGLSVYMDGVRLNQPFGDIVSWDLIPRIAISEMTLIPGSNPLFGLNTLGGALSLQTKDGRAYPGTVFELSGGSFGRKQAEFEHGGSNTKGLNWFLASSFFFEDGWRDTSPSNVRQFFAKLGWQGSKTSISLTAVYANNLLNGNGLQEQRLLQRDYTSIYNKPDVNGNRSPLLNLSIRHSLRNVSISGNAYYRYIRTSSFNADINEDALDESVYQPTAADIAALTAAGYKGFPTSGANSSNTPFPFWRCLAQALQKDEPVEKCNGVLNRTGSAQHNGGIGGQVSRFATAGKIRHQFTAGAAWDRWSRLTNPDFRSRS